MEQQSNSRRLDSATNIRKRTPVIPRWGLGAIVVFILIVTLTPFGTVAPLPFSFEIGGERRWLADGILNLCLFLPLGLAVGWDARSPVAPVLAGLLLSCVVEIAQTVVPGRDPALSDIVFNTLGAAAGGLIAQSPRSWLAPDQQQRVMLTTMGVAAVAFVLIATAVLLAPLPRSSGVLGRSGEDLVLRYPTRASSIGLDEPEYWLPRAFADRAVGANVPVRVARDRERWYVTIGAKPRATLGPTVGQGWTLLAYPDAIGRRWGRVLNGVWLFVLLLPVGYWTRGNIRFIAAGIIVAVLALIPALAGVATTSLLEWLGVALGFFAGNFLPRFALVSALTGTSRQGRHSLVVEPPHLRNL